MDISSFNTFYMLMQNEQMDGISYIVVEYCTNRSIKEPLRGQCYEIPSTLQTVKLDSIENIVSILFSALTHIIHKPTFAP